MPPKRRVEQRPPGSSDFEQWARERKARKLFGLLHAAGVSPESAAALPRGKWDELAKQAGVNKPSITTIGLVVTKLREAVDAVGKKAVVA